MKHDVIQIRRDLHQIPELDKNLPKTLSYIKNVLADLRCEVIIPYPSSICAYFGFQRSHTIAYRSDMDALPIQEHTQSTYASRHFGHMHACGHDGHMAMLLQFAKEVDALPNCSYNVLLIFQPAEETTGGAEAICNSGILQSKHTIAVYGLHLWPNLPAHAIVTKQGFLMARSSEIILHVHGKGTHIATSEQGIDALWITTQLIEKLYHTFPASEHYLLKFGYLQSGTAGNCISEYSILKGSLRTYENQCHQTILKSIQASIEEVEVRYKCSITLETSKGYPALYNNEYLFNIVSQQGIIQTLENKNYLTDDFSYFAQNFPSLYCYLGTGENIPLHSDAFDFDETTLLSGVAFYKRLLTLDYQDMVGIYRKYLRFA